MSDDYGNGGQQRWRMTMAVDDNGLQDWAGDYDGEGQERAARDGRDRGVGGGGRQQQRTTMVTMANKGSGQ